MTRVDALRKELADLEANVWDAPDYVQAKTEIGYLEGHLEYEEEILWLTWTRLTKSAV
jgi:hypothetical protein